MLYSNRIDISEETDNSKTSASKECDFCYYQCFLNTGFKFQPNFCNRCLDLLMMSMNRSDITILNIKSADCGCIISAINKNEAINKMQNGDLTEKSRLLKNMKICYHL